MTADVAEELRPHNPLPQVPLNSYVWSAQTNEGAAGRCQLLRKLDMYHLPRQLVMFGVLVLRQCALTDCRGGRVNGERWLVQRLGLQPSWAKRLCLNWTPLGREQGDGSRCVPPCHAIIVIITAYNRRIQVCNTLVSLSSQPSTASGAIHHVRLGATSVSSRSQPDN